MFLWAIYYYRCLPNKSFLNHVFPSFLLILRDFITASHRSEKNKPTAAVLPACLLPAWHSAKWFCILSHLILPAALRLNHYHLSSIIRKRGSRARLVGGKGRVRPRSIWLEVLGSRRTPESPWESHQELETITRRYCCMITRSTAS